jgi:CBS domain-containing protein
LAKWKCYRCGEIYEQDTPPDICTKCNANVSFWIDWTEAKTPLDEPVGKYTHQEVMTIDINESAWSAAKLMREKKAGSVFVSQSGNPVGIVTERDMLNKIVAEDLPAAHVLLRKIMSSPLVSVDVESSVRSAMELMRNKGFRRLLVTSNGKPIGVVTQQDLVEKALGANAS